jgi:uncharacterized protein Yka (UPF0111/DUF47 family)
MSRRAKAEAFEAVRETCPEVDDALAVAAKAIKQQTTALRDALIGAVDARLEVEDERDALQTRIEQLEAEVDDLRRQIAAGLTT